MNRPPAPVSAVVPCYRSSGTVERAVRSILDQTLPVAEIILVDDGSGDGTLETLHGIASRLGEDRVQVIGLERNSGPGAARNAGWERATQPWVAFLDSDDAWHPRKVELQFDWLERNPDVALCAHRSDVWKGAPGPVPDRASAATVVTGRRLLFRNPIPTRSVLLRRDLPVRFRDRRHAEDYLLWLEVVFHGYPCHLLPLTLAYSFRPEFSVGGYSGKLWAQESRELKTLRALRQSGSIDSPTWLAASAFSLVKYVRRVLLEAVRSRAHPRRAG